MPRDGDRVAGTGMISSPLNMPVGKPIRLSKFAIRCLESWCSVSFLETLYL